MRVLAVDWSGARVRPQDGIAVAEAGPDGLVAVRGDLDRDGVVDHVLDLAARGPLVVGLDFSFGLPEWFLRDRRCGDVEDLWALVAQDGERWLDEEPDPFWGRRGKRPPDDPARPGFRRTEECLRALGLAPKSTFQIGGAGAVGTGSLRGMPHLPRLRREGVAVWPFDDAGIATAVEIYPSVWTSGARRLAATRRARVAADPRIDPSLADAASRSEHAFDAAASALAMAAHRDELLALRAAPDGTREAGEGAVWLPAALVGADPLR